MDWASNMKYEIAELQLLFMFQYYDKDFKYSDFWDIYFFNLNRGSPHLALLLYSFAFSW